MTMRAAGALDAHTRAQRLSELSASEPTHRLTAHEFVYRVLRRGILQGAFPPGARLVQSDIAGDLDVSVTPVREALRNLATEGFIQLHPHKGALVRAVDIEEARDIMAMRGVLEPLCVARAVQRATDDDLEELRSALAAMQHEPDNDAWLEAHRRFHAVMIDAAQSPTMSLTARQLRDAGELYVAVTLRKDDHQRERGTSAHAAMLAAFEERDSERAAELATEHVAQALAALERVES